MYLPRIQKIGLELLDAVDAVCKEHGIEYFLMFGTLLGAVRHKGFIPWDDDIDIIMTRENWLRFVEVAPKELDTEKYHFMMMGSGSGKYHNEIKIGKKGTTYCLKGTEHLNIMKEVHIDVFCWEDAKYPCPGKKSIAWKIWQNIRVIKLNRDEKRLLAFCIDNSAHRGKWIFKTVLWSAHILRMLFGEMFFEWLGRKLLVDESGQSDSYWEGTDYKTFKKEWFKDVKYVDFEGKKYPAPAGMHEFLTVKYGDYMKLPPVEQRGRSNLDSWIFIEA